LHNKEYLNFDAWSHLAKLAPQEFEQQRRATVEKLIAMGCTNPAMSAARTSAKIMQLQPKHTSHSKQ
jgi:hypothetical protein